MMNLLFFENSILLGLGLSADAFSMCLVNGLNEQSLKRGRSFKIAGVFAFFQALMPMLGWYFVHGLIKWFSGVRKYLPLTAFILLTVIGIKMLIPEKGEEEKSTDLSAGVLIAQGFATSVDALSAGFTMGDYSLPEAFAAAAIIAAVTFAVSYTGLKIGKKAGEKLHKKASILGAAILILLGFKILIFG